MFSTTSATSQHASFVDNNQTERSGTLVYLRFTVLSLEEASRSDKLLDSTRALKQCVITTTETYLYRLLSITCYLSKDRFSPRATKRNLILCDSCWSTSQRTSVSHMGHGHSPRDLSSPREPKTSTCVLRVLVRFHNSVLNSGFSVTMYHPCQCSR